MLECLRPQEPNNANPEEIISSAVCRRHSGCSNSGISVYLNRAHLAHWQLSPEQDHIWEVILKAIAGYLALSGALIAVLHSTEIARREARTDFSVKQQDVYFRLVEAMSTVANEVRGTAERLAVEKRFWRLYWGEVVLVEDGLVAESIAKYSVALWHHPDDSENLSVQSMHVARACRNSLGKTWAVEQTELPSSSFMGEKPISSYRTSATS